MSDIASPNRWPELPAPADGQKTAASVPRFAIGEAAGVEPCKRVR
ncbi:MAG TPA: hypothetical protein VFN25_08030 [Dokdonella sp.]|nr:hypothetical protein [Dokdonella sp.]HET9032838.1 hypothetical protein [Dokdonella sp.]